MSEQVNKAKSVITESSVHYDRPLSDYSVKVVQEDTEFKARMIVSNFNSSKKSDQYYFYEPAYFMVNQVKARAEGTEASMAKYGVSRKTFTTAVFALKQPVTDEQVANADMPIDRVYEDATKFITRQFLLNKEKAFASALLAPAIWATNWTGVDAAVAEPVVAGEFQKFTKATSAPLDVMDAAMEAIQLKSGLRPNTVVMPRSVFTALKRNQVIKTTKLYTNANSGSDDAVLDTIASHLGLSPSRIFVLDVVEPSTAATVNGTTYAITVNAEGYATNAAGDTDLVNQFVGGKGILFMHVDMASSGQYSATAAVCCQWTSLYPDAGALGNTAIKRYREESLSSEMIEGQTAFSYHVVAPALGLYLANVI